MNNKFIAVILFSFSISLFSMQPDKKDNDLNLTQDQVVFWCLDQIEPVINKDIKLLLVNSLREIYFSDGLKNLKNKKFEQARELFLSIKLNSQQMSQILSLRPFDAEEKKRFFTDEIINLFKEAAQLDPSLDKGLAQINYGYIYNFALGVEQDFKEAAHWFRLSAEQGNAQAQFELHQKLAHGQGVEKDLNKATHFLKLSAKHGYVNAQKMLSFFYEQGWLVERNYKEAIRFLNLAAKQGDAAAQLSLGREYERGRMIEQDYKKAAYWYKLSAAQGDKTSKRYLERIAQNI